METRLTLKLNESVIEKAKEYAKTHNISLSKIVEQYLSSIVAKSDVSPKEIELTPLVKELSGVIKIPTDYDYKKDYIDYLEKKYQ
ncbi:DUF6364 family protein [Parabacteroides faecis]|uniref:DUF6364 family protein n=1 Tax=Parabacteroides faecis TaxID=1217282 RepID=UPI002164A676|nr:DUF6364 family protein [Parabacteroides faecis]MCS2892287.1 DUF6364 family protein [Parabacteroides faecis]UVQ49074.1 DUF6364 family protein [Parabacteroides faecis]